MKKFQVINNCTIGSNTKIYEFVNLYGCSIGKNCKIGTFVEIQKGVSVGNNVKIQSHTFICEGVTIEDDVFIGHHVVFINDNFPRSVNKRGILKSNIDWEMKHTIVKKGASVGSNATILGGIVIGEDAMIGAGSVVTKDIAPGEVVVGVPAKKLR